MVIVDHLTYRAIIIEILKLPRNCKMLLLLLKPLIGQKIKSYLNLFSKAATTFIFCFHQNQKNVCLASFKAHLPYVILHKVKKRAKIGCRLSPHK